MAISIKSDARALGNNRLLLPPPSHAMHYVCVREPAKLERDGLKGGGFSSSQPPLYLTPRSLSKQQLVFQSKYHFAHTSQATHACRKSQKQNAKSSSGQSIFW
jgi:hypothetical protein